MRSLLLFSLLALAAGAAESATAPAAPAVSASAEAIYKSAKPRLLQIRTLVNSASQKSSTGSGFLVSASGLAVTNYHVVSQHAMEPQTYRMEYVSADGSHGDVKLLAFDVVNDLALIQLDKGGWQFFEFDARALADNLPRGEKLFSLGNPLDIGFAVMEGNYSGLVERSYNERIHLSGPMNPGMSGGPTLSSTSRIAGINVAKIAFGAEQVSFLVPAKFAAALLKKARLPEPITAAASRAEIGRQLVDWQVGLYDAIEGKGFQTAALGPYTVPENADGWFTCWARTNADAKPKPRAQADQSSCDTQIWHFISGELRVGDIEISHAYYSSLDLNAFQFSTFVAAGSANHYAGGSVKRMTAPACHEDFVKLPGDEHPPLRVQWCAVAYRDFAGLYNIDVSAITQDHSLQMLTSRIEMNGVSYENAARLARRFLADIKVKP